MPARHGGGNIGRFDAQAVQNRRVMEIRDQAPSSLCVGGPAMAVIYTIFFAILTLCDYISTVIDRVLSVNIV